MACVAEASSTVTSGRTGAGSSAAGADSVSVRPPRQAPRRAQAADLGLGGRSLSGLGSLRALRRPRQPVPRQPSAALGLGLHRRDKAGRHTVKLANTGKRTLDILGARFGHSCHVTLGGLGTGLALGIGLTRSVGPAVTVPVVDVCHTWPPFSVAAAIGFSHP